MIIYMYNHKVSSIVFKPEKCDGCGEPFKDDDSAFSFQDENGVDLVDGWYCRYCATYIKHTEFKGDKVIEI